MTSYEYNVALIEIWGGACLFVKLKRDPRGRQLGKLLVMSCLPPLLTAYVLLYKKQVNKKHEGQIWQKLGNI